MTISLQTLFGFIELKNTTELPHEQLGVKGHIHVLDGWRGVSILLVLAAHLLPLGPHHWELNQAAGVLGMVLFFVLSGFLITSFLRNNPNVIIFLVRRFFRIIPLAWLYLVISLAISQASLATWYAHIFFYANLPPKSLLPLTDHMWSLCVEVQFYVGAAVLVGIFKKYGVYLLPILCLFFTGVRVRDGVLAASISYYRIDEILAGCILALIYCNHFFYLSKVDTTARFQWFFLILLIISCSPYSVWFNYFRPYIAALLIGSTILGPNTSLARLLRNKFLYYLAGISFSLYVIHPILVHSWLGSGDVLVKYMKRPLLFLVLLFLAILSTKYFERWFVQYGRKLSSKLN